MIAIYVMLTNFKGVSSVKLSRDIGVSRKTAWFIVHRIRETMQDDHHEPFLGLVEADETYISGKTKNMHAGERAHYGLKVLSATPNPRADKIIN